MSSPMFYKTSPLKRILIALGITLAAVAVILLAIVCAKLYLNGENKVSVNNQPEITALDFELDPGISYQTATSDAALFFYSAENLKVINTKGELIEDRSLKLARPTISVKGDYALFFDMGGRNVITFNGTKESRTLELEENILLASINRHGHMLIITEGDLHNCSARVYDANGKEIFKWNSGSLSVIGADISDNNKDITISALNTDGAALKNQIIMFNIAKEKPFTSDTYEGDIFSIVRYKNNHVYCIGSASTKIYNNYGKCVGTADYESRNLQHYCLNGNTLVLAFSGASAGSGVAEIKSYNHKGEVLGSFSVMQEFDFIDARGDNIAVNNSRTVSVLNERCQEKHQVAVNFDLRDFAFFGSQNKGVGITASGAVLIKL